MKGRLLTNVITPEERLEKIHVSLMRDKRTALFSGIMLMGKNEVVDDCPTAKTDGLNKYYGKEFISKLTDPELRALVWHENGHVALKHMLRFKSLMEKGEGQLVNIACDYEAHGRMIEEGMRQGQILAGKLGGTIPRSVTDMLAPKIDWKDVLRDFIQSSMKGQDEYTWRKFNKRHMVNDIYLPSVEDEAVGELVVAIDVSGSIDENVLNTFASELSAICVNTQPEKVRVLWWDTKVSSEQVFDSKHYEHIKDLLKATGGGGTNPECIDKYLIDKKIKAEALIVLTDGYFSKPKWNSSIPSLWVCTERDDSLPSNAKAVRYQD